MISEELRKAGISLVNKADVQEWLTVDRHKPGHTLSTMEDIIMMSDYANIMPGL